MPKKDIRVTQALRDAKLLEHRDSYITLDGHLILRGADKSRIRPLIFKKFRNKCVMCGWKLDPEAQPYHPNCGAWHHPGPCSCVGCTELRCDATTGRPCHAHRTIGFKRAVTFPNPDAAFPDSRVTRAKDARKIFEKLYPTGE